MHATLAGTREAFGVVLLLRIGLFHSQTSICCEGTVKIWRQIVSVVCVASWLLLHIGEVDEFREEYFPWQRRFCARGQICFTMKAL